MDAGIGLGAWMASVYIGFVIGIGVCVFGHLREKRAKAEEAKREEA